MSYEYAVLTPAQVRLLDRFQPNLQKVKFSELLDNALSLVSGEIPAGSVDATKLTSSLVPVQVVKYAGSHTTVGGGTSEDITVSGVLATDIPMVMVKTLGGTPVTVRRAIAASNKITVGFSADPSNDQVLSYIVFRAD